MMKLLILLLICLMVLTAIDCSSITTKKVTAVIITLPCAGMASGAAYETCYETALDMMDAEEGESD